MDSVEVALTPSLRLKEPRLSDSWLRSDGLCPQTKGGAFSKALACLTCCYCWDLQGVSRKLQLLPLSSLSTNFSKMSFCVLVMELTIRMWQLFRECFHPPAAVQQWRLHTMAEMRTLCLAPLARLCTTRPCPNMVGF